MSPALSSSSPAAAPIVLTRAEAADASRVTELVRAAYAKWVALIGREPLPMNADYGRAIAAHRIDLLTADGELVGVIETAARSDHLWIENVAVLPSRQGKGFGRRLLAHAESLAAAQGLVELRLLTNEAFEANIALYHRVGYEITRTEPFMGGVTVHMAKRLGEDRTNGMEIRAIEDADLEEAVELWASSGVSRPWNDPWRDIAFARQSQHATILVGRMGERMVATAMVGEDGHRGWVYYVATAPDLQRGGLGRAMMTAAEAWLVERGIWKLQLLVRADNATARGFYERLGYRDTGAVCFQKVIQGDPAASDAR